MSPQLAITATFTAEPIEPSLRLFLSELGWDWEVAFAPYGQVFQALLDPNSVLGRNRDGANLVLVRPEDWARDLEAGIDPAHHLGTAAAEFGDALRAFVERSPVPVVVALFKPSKKAPAATGTVFATIKRTVESTQATILLEEEIEAYAPAPYFDETADDLAHVPFTQAAFAAMGAAVARKLHALKVPSHKVLILDCDNTIWDGVVGEDGVEGIELTPAARALQAYAVDQKSVGTLITLASKNIEADVEDAFKKRSEFPLKWDDLTTWKVNWQPKAANIAAMAGELNLGADSFVFIDDNPVECAQVRAALPQVLTVELPAPDKMTGFLRHFWAFDRLNVTSEDRQRTEMYRQNAERQRYEGTATSIDDFLAGLNLDISVATPFDDEWPRVSQLTQRTNQFNFTTVRRNESDVRKLSAEGLEVCRVRLKDRFGDYGIVGIMIFGPRDGALRVDSFMLSCRALGKGVEHAMVRHLGERACELGLPEVQLPYLRTAKNEPARAFADSLANVRKTDPSPEATELDYVLTANDAAAVQHLPGGDPEAVVKAAKGKKKAKAVELTGRGKWEIYGAIAELQDAAAILARLDLAAPAAARNEEDIIHPESPTEARIAAVWQDILRVDRVGVTEDWFALGGTSLSSVFLFVRLAEELGKKLPLSTIVEANTVRALAERFDGGATTSDKRILPMRVGAGGPTLFLVHDGDGETLLYRNLAARLPEGWSVMAIKPVTAENLPLAATRIEDMAARYIEEVRAVQPQGPYFLGGMCAGGTIAFEMGRQLESSDQTVGAVVIMDAAAPGAKRNAFDTTRRWRRLKSALNLGSAAPSDARSEGDAPSAAPIEAPPPSDNGAEPSNGRLGAALNVSQVVAGKAYRLAKYVVSERVNQAVSQVRFRRLRADIDAGRPVADWAKALTFRQIYDLAEADYRPSPLDSGRVLLIRATEEVDGDVPYRLIYAEPDLSWQRYIALPLTSADVPGGHASMLQEGYVDSLAAVIVSFVDRFFTEPDHDQRKATASGPDRNRQLQVGESDGEVSRVAP